MVTVKITNDYSDGYHSEHEALVDPPDMDVKLDDIYEDAVEQWFNEVVLEETGDASHDSTQLGYCYTATVIAADDASLVGREYEWAGY